MKASPTHFDINNPPDLDAGSETEPQLDGTPISTSRTREPDTLIHAVISQTEAPTAGKPVAAAFIIGKCQSPYHPDQPGRCQVNYTTAGGRPTIQWLRHMQDCCFSTGDSVLLTTPSGTSQPLVLGCLAKTEPDAQKAPGGRRLIIDRKEGTNEATDIRLELADGRTLIEIDLQADVPTIRIPDKDLTMDIEGRLKIAARSIELESKLGNVNVKANDDFKVNAERIYLN